MFFEFFFVADVDIFKRKKIEELKNAKFHDLECLVYRMETI